MTENDALFDWNRLNKENHENLAASKIYEALLTTFPASLEAYLSWFTAGVGATLALLLSNVDKIAPYLGAHAYARAIAAFGISVVAGAAGKLTATYVIGAMAMSKQITADISDTLAKFDIEAAKIQGVAKQQRIHISSDFDLASLMEKVGSQMSWIQRIIRSITMRRMEKAENQVLYRFRLPMRLMNFQGFCFLIAVCAAATGVSFVASAVAHKAFANEALANPAVEQSMPIHITK